MNLLLFILFGLVPSFIWLAFYLRKDAHPEPNAMVLKVFFFGMLFTFPAVLIEQAFQSVLRDAALWLGNALAISAAGTQILFELLFFFFAVALLEELVKYAVVRWSVFSSEELDEPFDLMLYMIVAALGFAGMENILKFPGLGLNPDPSAVVYLSAYRFLGATLLHALASGLFGYFLALSFYGRKSYGWYFFCGLVIVTVLHGLFDFSIIHMRERIDVLYPVSILAGLAVFVSFGLAHVKKLKSMCKLS